LGEIIKKDVGVSNIFLYKNYCKLTKNMLIYLHIKNQNKDTVSLISLKES